MTQELKDQWLQALRGDEYQQGKDALKIVQIDQPDKNCCLGVLCDIIVPDGWDDDSTPAETGDNHVYVSGWQDASAGDIPSVLVLIIGRHVCSLLMAMNDNDGKTFLEIADYIEANIPATAE